MTVEELIKQLQKAPPDALAVLVAGDHNVCDITGTHVFEDTSDIENRMVWVTVCVEPLPEQKIALIASE